MSPFRGFGPANFLVGDPEFDFSAYRSWIDERFKPNRYPQLREKMDEPSKYAIGAFIQSLRQNPGLEEELKRLGTAAHIYVGSGLGNIGTLYDNSLDLYRAQKRWNRFWADPERNALHREFLESGKLPAGAPRDPQDAAVGEREEVEHVWLDFWARHSDQLGLYLDELQAIEALAVEGDVEAGKMRLMKRRARLKTQLRQKWGDPPPPPWEAVSANVIWNIQNTPAAQISMLGEITGLAFSPVAACSTFGVALKLGADAIRRGEAKAVVVGATDPAPHPLVVGAFYAGRVLAASRDVSKPLGELRGTHIAGGAAVWVLGDYEHMSARGFEPLGMEPLGVGVSSDADHIITPSQDGPTAAIHLALEDAEVQPQEIEAWDLHATATPGDYQEIATLRGVVGDKVLVSARKGTFGHGMAAGGGWELTAQYLGHARGQLFPTPLREEDLNEQIATVHESFVYDTVCPAPKGVAGKLSMGIGGINACVVSRPW
ncbi:MAG: beta-ketoacyl synthase N-terminal-like domain-containing protein [Acidobacteriota bacterium]